MGILIPISASKPIHFCYIRIAKRRVLLTKDIRRFMNGWAYIESHYLGRRD